MLTSIDGVGEAGVVALHVAPFKSIILMVVADGFNGGVTQFIPICFVGKLAIKEPVKIKLISLVPPLSVTA
ncbi:hypothetical protein [Anoxynatronum sibiricum]|uniref:Uncharacterized protein n=1 Tax=Anoxynatronum sibiricum TaxID=210623 RepID=A0ABU9VRW7_9CLOT